MQNEPAPPPVTIRLLGEFSVCIGGRVVTGTATGRRDPVRLAGYLALSPRRRAHREQVIDALWPDAPLETVANRLHKAAHFLRKVIGFSGSVVLGGDSVALSPAEDGVLEIDVDIFDRLARAALDPALDDASRSAAAEQALRVYRGDLLPQEVFADWAFHPRQRLQLRHRELLRRGERFDELVALDPTDEQAHVGLMQRLLEVGDRASVLRQFNALSDVLERQLGVGPSVEARALRDVAVGPPSPGATTSVATSSGPTSPGPTSPGPTRAANLATQRVSFCHTSDGVRLAYAVSGAGPPLVKASNWLTHLDHDWDSLVWRHWWHALSQRHQLVRYDERGCGLSDWEVDTDSFTLDAWVRDLETVVDALGLERFPLLGISQGGPIAITYAARHPERVSHVVVYGTCARATWAKADDERRRELAALGELIKTSWGATRPGARQVLDAQFLPDGPIEAWRDFDELQRRSSSARNAHRLWRAFGSLDCAESARRLDVPTLILHSVDDQVWAFDEAEELQAMVPGSRLVSLPSNNHILQAGEPAFGEFVREVEAFIQT